MPTATVAAISGKVALLHFVIHGNAQFCQKFRAAMVQTTCLEVLLLSFLYIPSPSLLL